LIRSGQRSREHWTRGHSTKSGDSVTLLSAFVLVGELFAVYGTVRDVSCGDGSHK
jgi:hypothetical protein